MVEKMHLKVSAFLLLSFVALGLSFYAQDSCSSNPCGYGGQCVNQGYNAYTCVCRDGYTYDGSKCVLWPCYGNPCGEYGSCRYEGKKHWCECLEGYQGEPCTPVYNQYYRNKEQYYPKPQQQYYPKEQEQYYPKEQEQYYPKEQEQYYPKEQEQYYPKEQEQYYPKQQEQYYPQEQYDNDQYYRQ